MKTDIEIKSTEELLSELGVMKTGHFVLTSGRHSSFYFEKFRILERPETTSVLCARMADIIKKKAGPKIDLVCGPATGGMILAFEVAKILRLGCVYLEKSESGFCLLRGMRIPIGAKTLIVDDVLTTGKSLDAAHKAIVEAGGSVVLKAVMIDRRKAKDSLDAVLALYTAQGEDYLPDQCPLCTADVPLVDPKTGREILRR
ncbi:orotate phosphoribosyltransferase [candidate division WOR-3 bacterium]|nr:orotate phosphoribosyltransferase [candidate division WOR-3 bacterium]